MQNQGTPRNARTASNAGTNPATNLRKDQPLRPLRFSILRAQNETITVPTRTALAVLANMTDVPPTPLVVEGHEEVLHQPSQSRQAGPGETTPFNSTGPPHSPLDRQIRRSERSARRMNMLHNQLLDNATALRAEIKVSRGYSDFRNRLEKMLGILDQIAECCKPNGG
jgi:hypothetical protein